MKIINIYRKGKLTFTRWELNLGQVFPTLSVLLCVLRVRHCCRLTEEYAGVWNRAVGRRQGAGKEGRELSVESPRTHTVTTTL